MTPHLMRHLTAGFWVLKVELFYNFGWFVGLVPLGFRNQAAILPSSTAQTKVEAPALEYP